LAVNYQAGHDTLAKLPDLLLYNSALFKRHRLPVRSLLVLLHKGADSAQLTGFYERGFPDEAFDVALRYRVVRVWQVPPEQWLSGGLGVLPLAPLGAVQEADLPLVLAQMKQRLEREVTRSQATELWSAAYILMGLRYERATIQTLLQGVITMSPFQKRGQTPCFRGSDPFFETGSMKESVTYQAILREGKTEGETSEARKILLLLGRDQLGEPSADVRAAIDALVDVNRLEELTVRLKHAATWHDLLGLPSRRRRSPRRKPSS
jgi:hypothetical protein